MIKYMGEGSGWLGIVLAFLMGSIASAPLYGAFPVATVLIKKGSKLSNVFIFIGAWSTTKISLLLFETASMGLKFMLTRLVLDLFGIAGIAFFTYRFLSEEEKEKIFQTAESVS